jgi:multidrug efflux pump subunit AcrA (membrane-fusion protein)
MNEQTYAGVALKPLVVKTATMADNRASRPLDAIAKLVVIILIACFLGVAGYVQLKTSVHSVPAVVNSPPPPGGGQGGGRGATANAITVSAKTLQPETIRQRIALNGNVSSRTEVGIYPNIGGKVTTLRKAVGDTVRSGDVIALVDPSRPGTSYALSPVTATVGGTIIDLPVNAGETVTTGSVLATIGSLNDLIVTVYVSEKYTGYLKTGLHAYVTLAADQDTAYLATVTAVKPVVNSKNRTIETTLSLDKPVPGMRPGMFAAVSLVIREESGALVVPKTAVKAYNDTQVVYVVDKGMAKRVPVTLGLTTDTEAQIAGGLSPSDRVVIAGAVTDGSRVRIAGE